MKRAYENVVLGLVVAATWVSAGFFGCAANAPNGLPGGTGTKEGMGGSGGTSTTTAGPGGSSGGLALPDAGNAGCPSTCKQLGADCGPVTDTKCGGIVLCGDCPAGRSCGGGGTPNVCGAGTSSDACAPTTCAAQGISCGPAGDGCGGVIQCGSCALPQTCGGNPQKPGQCGCTGVCAQVPTCSGTTTTTFSGTVYDPAGVHPLYNALVYIPNNPSDPGLQPFPAGITCDVCGATAAGDPLVSTYTAPDGTFSLPNVPVGDAIPLVVQLGRWRRQFTVAIPGACAANTAPGMLTMPKTHLEGDIPRVAILTGGYDPVECTLRKMGVADSEFTNPDGGGRINFYTAIDSDQHYTLQGHGAAIDAQTPAQAALFATTSGGQPVIDQYDMVVLECEGYPQTESASDLAAMLAYANAGGRIFASDFAYAWLQGNGSFANAANWTGAQWAGGVANNISIDLTSNPKGMAFAKWLEVVGVSTAGSHLIAHMYPGFHNTGGVTPPTQQWLYWNAPPHNTSAPLHFTFNTPVGAASTNQCGRVVFSDWHAEQPGTGGAQAPQGAAFPAECESGPMTPQQAILEFTLFDLSACVQPYTPICTPKTCAQQMIGCGPASDGCGGVLDCGPCPMGQFCGGGGPGQCGTSATCSPATCHSQGIECGPAGDGCGHEIDCGNCPTGQICGAAGPGKCGKVQ
jgi:hypothetical protein